MLLEEAAQRAESAAQIPVLGRPTGIALPAAMAQGTIVSLGCVGNRVYTDLGEGEMYGIIPGRDLGRVAREVETVVWMRIRCWHSTISRAEEPCRLREGTLILCRKSGRRIR